MLIVYVALMIVGLVGLIVCQKKQKTNPNAQALAFVFLIVILAGAGGMLYNTIFASEHEQDRIIANEIAFAQARSKVLAEYVGQTWKGQSAVIISEPDIDQNKIAKAGLDAMQAALKAAGIDVAAVETLNIPKSSSEDPVPMESALTAKIYNEVFNKYKNAGIFVIMSQLPFDSKELKNLACWKFDPKKTRIVLVNGEIYNLKGAIVQGIVGAAIAMKTGPAAYDPEKAAPKDVKAAFDTRFILINSKNVKEIAEKQSNLFAK